MQKSSFLSVQDKKVILHKPLHYNTDWTEIGRQAKRVLLEIREAVGKPVRVGFSGGTDSLFLLFSYLELVKEGKINKDDFIITSLKFISKKDDSPKIYPGPLGVWLRDRYDKYIDENYVFYAGDIDAFVNFRKKLIEPIPIGVQLLQMAREELGEYIITANSYPTWDKKELYLPVSTLQCLQSNTLDIDLFTWDVDIFCSIMDKKRMQPRDDDDYYAIIAKIHRYDGDSHNWSKHFRYFECYPECMHGFPKRIEEDFKQVRHDLLNISAIKEIFYNGPSSYGDLKTYIYNDKLEQIKTVEDSLWMIT